MYPADIYRVADEAGRNQQHDGLSTLDTAAAFSPILSRETT